jgi:hypothetical protein
MCSGPLVYCISLYCRIRCIVVVIMSLNMITYVICHTDFYGVFWLHYKSVLEYSLL